MPGHELFSAFFLAVNIASLISRFKIFKKQIIYIKNPHHIGEDATLNLLDSIPTTIAYLRYNHREKAVLLLHGHIARNSVHRAALVAKKVPGCGCTDGQACLHSCTDIARINPHEQEGDQPNCECGWRLRECVST